MPIRLTINIDVDQASPGELTRVASALNGLAGLNAAPVALKNPDEVFANSARALVDDGAITQDEADAAIAARKADVNEERITQPGTISEPPKRGPGRPRKDAAAAAPPTPPPPPHVNVPTENDPQSLIQAAPADLKIDPPPPPPPPPERVAFDENELAALRAEIKAAAQSLMAAGTAAKEVMAVFNRFKNADGVPASGASSVPDADVATCLAALRSLA